MRIRRLDELVALSDAITVETKTERLLALIGDEFPTDEPVLLFTEYKATQALVVNALHRRFGFGSATFINGDDRLDGLEQASGSVGVAAEPRERAAEAFNAGRVRFLVSTEAGGEGIDLQESCAVLVHVDMPWNPMRLHQRVGRLSRYGQTRPVSVYLLRNPETVESRIWDLLNEKLERIQAALSAVMEQQEDVAQLVIGMAGNALFNELFSGAQGKTEERLTSWFDRATATLGGRDVIETVREIFGSVSHFDFQQVGKDLPQVDLDDLERFFARGRPTQAPGLQTVRGHRSKGARCLEVAQLRRARQVRRTCIRPRPSWQERCVSRARHRPHPVRHRRGRSAQSLGEVRWAGGDTNPILVLSVEDEVTGTGSLVNRLIFGVADVDGRPTPMGDWELLRLLNDMPIKGATTAPSRSMTTAECVAVVDRLRNGFESGLSDLAPSLRRPVCWPEMLFLPADSRSSDARAISGNAPASTG